MYMERDWGLSPHVALSGLELQKHESSRGYTGEKIWEHLIGEAIRGERVMKSESERWESERGVRRSEPCLEETTG